MQRDAGLWQAVLGEIELSVSRGNYVTWFKRTQLVQCTDEIVVIGVPNVFIKQQLEKKYNDLIVSMLKKNGLEPARIDYKISQVNQAPPAAVEEPLQRFAAAPVGTARNGSGAQPPRSGSTFSPAAFDTIQRSSPAISQSGSTPAINYRQGLNEKYTFETFVVGSSNEVAYAACQAVAADIGSRYNPLYLYGGVGIGKTHLIQAVGNSVFMKNSRARIIYASTDQFVKEFVESLRFKKTDDFAKYYRSADVLIMDDMQFIAGKDKVQEEFFHTFNTLYQANKQIIITSDKPPREIPTLEERLVTRFLMGMSIDMQNPDFETRCAIIQTKAGAHNIQMDSDVVEYLANLVQTNVRELEGVLNQLLAFCEVRGLDPDLQTATGLLGSARSRPRHLSPKQIIERTARHFQISVDEILGPKRDKDIVVPRQIAMYMLRSELHLSFPKIARELGRKDHTTAIHSVEKIEKEANFDNSIRDAIKEIKERLYV
jgi:chromosomal replication initiator protein